MPKPAIILDFDNTIRFPKSGEFINGPHDFTLYPGVIKALQQTRREGWYVFGLTNQGGVAYEHKTEETWEAELEQMKQMSSKLGSGDWPFHKVIAAKMMEGGSNEDFAHWSWMRKPQPGGLAVFEHWSRRMHNTMIDWPESLMVGDSQVDLDLVQGTPVNFMWAEKWRKKINKNA